MFACEESYKACEKSGKACDESGKILMWKYLKATLSEKEFLEKDFCSFENGLLGCSRSLFQKEKPRRPMPIFVFFKSQCPKIMVLSKALKAKLSSIESQVCRSPPLSWRKWKNCCRCYRPSFNHPLWQQLPRTRGPIGRPLLAYMVLFVWSFGCFLSQWRKVGLPLALWQESEPNFKGLPKVSGVATNHWVFLRCDWSPVSSWFYYRSKVKKNVIFPNLMWVEKNLDS